MKTLICLFVVHFIADFICQPREMGKKKSYEPLWLLGHLAIQFVFFLFFGWKFALANAVIHGVIDWNIWRLYKLSVVKRHPQLNWNDKYQQGAWKYWEDHLFYTTIGLDQMLHGITLIVLWRYLL
jgi:hypothetical protein